MSSNTNVSGSGNTYVSGGHAMHRARNTVKSRQTQAEKKIGARERDHPYVEEVHCGRKLRTKRKGKRGIMVRRRHQEYRERKRGDFQKMKSHKIKISVAS